MKKLLVPALFLALTTAILPQAVLARDNDNRRNDNRDNRPVVVDVHQNRPEWHGNWDRSKWDAAPRWQKDNDRRDGPTVVIRKEEHTNNVFPFVLGAILGAAIEHTRKPEPPRPPVVCQPPVVMQPPVTCPPPVVVQPPVMTTAGYATFAFPSGQAFTVALGVGQVFYTNDRIEFYRAGAGNPVGVYRVAAVSGQTVLLELLYGGQPAATDGFSVFAAR